MPLKLTFRRRPYDGLDEYTINLELSKHHAIETMAYSSGDKNILIIGLTLEDIKGMAEAMAAITHVEEKKCIPAPK